MKRIIATTIIAFTCLTGFGQGTIMFQNLGPGVNAPVFGSDHVTKLEGSQYRAGLLAGPDRYHLSEVDISESFQVGAGAGYFLGGVRMIPNVPIGSVVWVQVVAWDTRAGATYSSARASNPGMCGESSVFSVVTGGALNPPPFLTGLTSFRLFMCLGNPIPTFWVQPTNQTVVAGGNATFFVAASACPGAASCQWYFNGTPIPGANGSSYHITGVQPTHAGTYHAVLSNPLWWEPKAYSSASAILTVVTSPIITSAPQSQTAFVGATASFKVNAAGAAPFAYQWFLGGSPLSNASNANLVLTNLQLSHAGAYTVTITNVYGAITSPPAVLTVLASPPILELSPWSRAAVAGTFLDFVVGAVGALPLSYQWYFNGVPIAGATASDLHLSNLQFSNSGNYAVVVTNAFGAVTSAPATLTVVPRPRPRRGTIVAWGSNSEGQCAVPAGLSNVTAIAAGGSQSLAIDSDGLVHAWGFNDGGQWMVPPGLTDVIAVSAGGYHSLALKSDGTVVAWGSDYYGQSTVPEGLRNVVAIAAGGQHSLALRSDGTVVVWGMASYGLTNVPIGLRGVTAIAAGSLHNLALKFDGTVVAWGYGYNVPTNVPPDLGGVTAIAASRRSLALKSDGTVKEWYGNDFGQHSVPVGLRGVTAITAGWDYFNSSDSHYLALRSDGTVTAWGYGTQGLNAVPAGLSDVITIAAGVLHNLALVSQEPAILSDPVSQTAEIGATVGLGAKAAGHPPLTYQWLFAGNQVITGATNEVLELPGIQPEQSGTYQLVVTNSAGAVTSAPAMLNVIPVVERKIVPMLTLMGEPGSSLNLEASEAVVPASNWEAFDSVMLASTSQWYFDLPTPLPTQRYFRAWQAGVLVAPALDAHIVPAITLTGAVGSAVQVDGINQFGPTDAWYPLATVTLTNTSQLYFDVSVIGQPTRLYRLVQVP